MKQTLVHFPHELLGLPLFGFGWILIAWLTWCVIWAILTWKRHASLAPLRSQLPVMALVAIVIVFIMPWVEPHDDTGQPIGMAIRGYGVMMMLGVIAGIGLAVQRGRRMGIHPDIIFSLALAMFLVGLAGARLFYVIQYWNVYFYPPGESFQFMVIAGRVLDFTKGGLVVYGALIGALVATLIFLHRHKLPKLAFADLVAPSMLVGLALGRIGCLLNGCCYGGVCPNDPLGMEFPLSSPPYVAQVHEGLLLGLELDDNNLVKNKVDRDSLAGKAGIKKDDRVQRIQFFEDGVLLSLGERGKAVVRQVSWQGDQLPERSVPVYPSQLLSSINALLLCFFLCTIYPYRTRDGQVFALMLILYAASRFLLEIIRSDEPHVYFSLFTPAQAVSLVILMTGLGILISTFRPAPLALPVQESVMMCEKNEDTNTGRAEYVLPDESRGPSR